MLYSEFLSTLKIFSHFNIIYDEYKRDFLQTKTHFKKINDENKLLKIWFALTVLEIINEYKNTFILLKDRKYEKAWYKLEEIELMIRNIQFNIDDYNEYIMLRWIENLIKKYQSIFPYKVFASPEYLDKKVECSICGCIMTPFSECKHIPGKVYYGEMCVRVVKEMDFLLLAMVKNPVQKYSVLFDGIEKPENYKLLELLMPKLRNEYDKWDYEIKIKYEPHEKIGRNKKCPCLSGKKYKDCCLNNPNGIKYEHYNFIFSHNPTESNN